MRKMEGGGYKRNIVVAYTDTDTHTHTHTHTYKERKRERESAHGRARFLYVTFHTLCFIYRKKEINFYLSSCAIVSFLQASHRAPPVVASEGCNL